MQHASPDGPDKVLLMSAKTPNTAYNRVITLYFCLIAVIGYFFVYLVTPVSGIDEQFHFERALQVSQGNLFPQRYDRNMLGGDLENRLIAFARYFENRRDRALSSDRQAAKELADALTGQPSGRERLEFPSTASYSPIMYLPSGLGLLTSRVLHARIDTQFFMGRLGNLIGYLLILALAVRTLPWGRLGIVLLFTTPTCLHLASTYSADPLTNALTLLFFALCLRSLQADSLTRRDLFLLALSGGTLGLLKLTCCVFSAAILMVPPALFTHRRSWLLFCGGVMGASIATALLWNIVFPFVPAVYWKTGGDPHLAAHLLLTHPWHVAGLVIRTLESGAHWWWLDIYGRFGGGPPPQFFKIGETASLMTAVLVFLLALTERKGPSRPLIGALFLSIGLASVMLILIAFYVGFTPVSSAVITGLQGRYFLLAAGAIYLGAIVSLPQSADRRGIGPILLLLGGVLTLRVSVAAMEIYSQNWH
ncbi:membrane protein [Swaminathania salitolerans LMG 21291]|nr:membrane protein [Swaminathania salitolerans LMG 21291]